MILAGLFTVAVAFSILGLPQMAQILATYTGLATIERLIVNYRSALPWTRVDTCLIKALSRHQTPTLDETIIDHGEALALGHRVIDLVHLTSKSRVGQFIIDECYR